MKLLLDANLSHRLASRLAGDFAAITHVRLVGQAQATDAEIWSYATLNGYTVVTRDSDFRDIQLSKGAPPKIIWLRLDNPLTARVAATLRLHKDAIAEFVADPESECLELQEPGPRVL